VVVLSPDIQKSRNFTKQRQENPIFGAKICSILSQFCGSFSLNAWTITLCVSRLRKVSHPHYLRIEKKGLKQKSRDDLDELIKKGLPVEFGHSLADLLGGQCDTGFVITDVYEDYMLDSPLHKYHPSYVATRALKR